MEPSDPFAALGLDSDATAVEVRSARRRLARAHHPDQGGDATVMQAINEAADAALAAIDGSTAGSTTGSSVTDDPEPPSAPVSGRADRAAGSADDEQWSGIARDVPSFTVEALPVDTFEALLVVTSWLGEVLDDEPPYRLDTYLSAPFDCWCRLDVVPDAGASTVSITVAGLDGAATPDVTAVRDAWVANLNAVDWP
jgi:hypothetical protein